MNRQHRATLPVLIAASFSFAISLPTAADSLVMHRIPAALAAEAVIEAVAACARGAYQETAVVVGANGARKNLSYASALQRDGTLQRLHCRTCSHRCPA